jgi:hypothetical protein
MRLALFITAMAALSLQASVPAHAGLIGAGNNTVTPIYWFGSPTNPPPSCTPPAPCEIPNYLLPSPPNPPGSSQNSPPPNIPVDFLQGAISGVTISVGDTSIVITNLLAGVPFCSGASPCTDIFTGFQFLFSSGVDIANVSVDPASAPSFLPNSQAPHMGLQLLSPTDILVDVTGDTPNVNDQLILDLTFPGSVTPGVPEPATWAMMLLGFAGLAFAFRQSWVRRRSPKGSGLRSIKVSAASERRVYRWR